MLRPMLAAACLIVPLVAALPAHAESGTRPDKVSFYFAAHADDWQLFMNPSAFDDVTADAAKTVFIHATAGDAGLGTGSGGRKHAYYLAREHGAEAAIRFMADTADLPAEASAGPVTINGHPIRRLRYRNTVSYFLRLPDGSPSGTGYGETGFQSLKRLAEGAVSTVTAVDGSTQYRGWNDLVATLRAILVAERGSAAAAQINVADLDAVRNPNDHADHLMTAKAALDAAQGMSCLRRVSYIEYASWDLPLNLTPEQRDREDSVFAVTLAGVLAYDHGTSWHHRAYVGRNYFRVEEPSEKCTSAAGQMAAAKR